MEDGKNIVLVLGSDAATLIQMESFLDSLPGYEFGKITNLDSMKKCVRDDPEFGKVCAVIMYNWLDPVGGRGVESEEIGKDYALELRLERPDLKIMIHAPHAGDELTLREQEECASLRIKYYSDFSSPDHYLSRKALLEFLEGE